MADDADRAQRDTETLTAAAVRYRCYEGPFPTGSCLHCEAALPAGRRWCDAECRDAWQEGEE